MFREQARDLVARALVGGLFALLSMNLLADFMRTGHITGLLLLVSEALIVVLTVIRRRARIIDRSTAAAVVTTVSIVGPPLLRATDAPGLLPDTATAVVSAFGLLLVIGGKMTLGRSFGIAPANRGVVARGPYLFVRHPIYAGYLITHVAFLVAEPTVLNLFVVAIADTALIARALIEERVLSMDAEYQSYCQRVAWHLVPGVF
jgi:protein-S-isoprenylcysteine O-methyltransferase Ste14